MYTEKIDGKGNQTGQTIFTTIVAFAISSALKVIFLALTSTHDALEDNYSRL